MLTNLTQNKGFIDAAQKLRLYRRRTPPSSVLEYTVPLICDRGIAYF